MKTFALTSFGTLLVAASVVTRFGTPATLEDGLPPDTVAVRP